MILKNNHKGDGSIKVPKTIRSKKENLLYPSLTIVFAEKDLPLANLLRDKLQATINKSQGNYYVISVYKLDPIYLLIKNINGKFRTPKIEALHRIIIWLNNYGKFVPTAEIRTFTAW